MVTCKLGRLGRIFWPPADASFDFVTLARVAFVGSVPFGTVLIWTVFEFQFHWLEHLLLKTQNVLSSIVLQMAQY